MVLKLQFKTVLGKQFALEFDEDTKVADVKAKIQETQGEDFAKGSMNVIHAGKILKDDATLKESNVSETGFCVVMVVKAKKPAAEAKPEEPAPAAAAVAAAVVPATAAAASAPAAAAEPAAAPAETAVPAAPADPYAASASELVVGEALEEKVQQICDMGFPREEVTRAMRAAFNNPERAVEYLMTGIPAGLDVPAVPAARAPAAAAGAGGAEAAGEAAAVPAAPAAPASGAFDMFAPAGAAGGAGTGAGGPLSFMRNNPQFMALRAIVQQSPGALHPMLQELGRSQPELLALINANQADFLAIMNEPLPPGTDVNALMAQMGGGDMGEGDEGGEAIEVELSDEERAAVERLGALGFPFAACLEAFLICDRNEALAANYLLENDEGGDM